MYMWSMYIDSFDYHTQTRDCSIIIPPSPYALVQSCDRTARVWDARSGVCVMRFEGHEGDINAVRFFPSGDALGTACNDGTVSAL